MTGEAADPVLYDQRILLGDPSGRPGDCLRAAVATVLQEDPDDVPHFAEAPDWIRAVLDWRPGLFRFDYRRIDGPIAFPADGAARPWVVGCGQSPRGVLHAVVLAADDGRLIHDPHPSRDGLSGPLQFVLAVIR
jgi:hypothetical protein